LIGGGNDGGSIPTRGEQVRIKRNVKRTDPQLLKRIQTLSCAVTKQQLRQHVVVDDLGYVFNKEAVIKCLLEKSMPVRFGHIRSLKNVYDVHFSLNQKYDPTLQFQSGAGLEGAALDSPYECAITGRPVNGQHTFSVLKTCGHVFSDKGLEETDSENTRCFLCDKPFTKSDILSLNPEDEDLEAMKAKLKEQTKQRQNKHTKKNKKEKKDDLAKPNTKETEEKQKGHNGKRIGKGEEKASKANPEENGKNGKRKLNKVDSKQPKKKPKVAPVSTTNGPSLCSVMAVQVALQKVGNNHNTKKSTSEAYKSIFSDPSEKTTLYLTGTIKGVIK